MRKVKRTTKSSLHEQESEETVEITQSDDTVEFTHLISSKDKPDEFDSPEDAEISDAIASITSVQSDKSMRKRPVRRKKQKD